MKQLDVLFVHPNGAPIIYQKLSKEYSEIRKGTQSLSDKKNELEYLEKFTSLKDEGKFLKFFVDNEIASEWISYTEERIKDAIGDILLTSDSNVSSYNVVIEAQKESGYTS